MQCLRRFAKFRPSPFQTSLASRTYATANTTPLPPLDYPHGPAQWYKQSNKGLYGGQRIQFGNNVSAKNEIKTRRKWLPNIKRKNLYSHALARSVNVRVSTRVLRTIDKLGGLDEYLLGETSARIRELGIAGWRLRCEVMGSKKVQTRFNLQRVALGLPVVDPTPDAGDGSVDAVKVVQSKPRPKRIIRRRM